MHTIKDTCLNGWILMSRLHNDAEDIEASLNRPLTKKKMPDWVIYRLTVLTH